LALGGREKSRRKRKGGDAGALRESHRRCPGLGPRALSDRQENRLRRVPANKKKGETFLGGVTKKEIGKGANPPGGKRTPRLEEKPHPVPKKKREGFPIYWARLGE